MTVEFVLEPAALVPPVALAGNTIEICSSIPFAYGTVRLLKEAYIVLNSVADLLLRHDEIKRVRIISRTGEDEIGRVDSTRTLLHARSRVVRDYLYEVGVARERMEVDPGVYEPRKATPAELARLRRVDFQVLERATDGAGPAPGEQAPSRCAEAPPGGPAPVPR